MLAAFLRITCASEHVCEAPASCTAHEHTGLLPHTLQADVQTHNRSWWRAAALQSTAATHKWVSRVLPLPQASPALDRRVIDVEQAMQDGEFAQVSLQPVLVICT